MNNRTRTIQLSALAALVAAVLTTGMLIQATSKLRDDVSRTPSLPLSLQADGNMPPPVLPVHPPKVFA